MVLIIIHINNFTQTLQLGTSYTGGRSKHTAAETNEPVAVAARKTMENDEDGEEQWRYSIQNIQW